MNQKGLAPILILLAVTIAAVVGGVYYLSRIGFEFRHGGPVATLVTPTPTPQQDEIANWKIHIITPDSSLGYKSYQIKLPLTWRQIEHSSNFQNMETFQDEQNVYQLVVEQQKNYNDQTGKPFVNLKEFAGLPYDVTTFTVNGQQILKLLPRAGSEHIYKSSFFSRDSKLIFSMMLKTPSDGSKIQEGEVLFNQILSTFKFIQ